MHLCRRHLLLPKPRIPQHPKKDNPAKDAICHQCGKVGHLRRNCPIYLLELMKKKKLSQGLQGLRGSRKLKPGALSQYVGDGHCAAVEAIGDFHLFYLDDNALAVNVQLDGKSVKGPVNPIGTTTWTSGGNDQLRELRGIKQDYGHLTWLHDTTSVLCRSKETTFSMEVFDNELVPSSLPQIAPIIRVANEFQSRRPRVAFLCRQYALEIANSLDESSSGPGVPQFKTAMIQRLQREEAISIGARVEKTDALELQNVLIQASLKALLEVIYHVFQELEKEVPVDIIALANEVEANAPYNILPLNSAGESTCIMQLEEIKAAVSAIRNTHGLQWPPSVELLQQMDLLDWLRAMFGFQKDNVRNQREDLILQLAHPQARLMPKPQPSNKLDDRAIQVVMKKLVKNYKDWCKFLEIRHMLRPPQGQEEGQQRNLLYMGLYLLIWGESANVRFLPECLCYIFHNMANEVNTFLAGNVTGENIKPLFSGIDDAFLHKVITPIYQVIEKESNRNKNGKAPHSAWCNYDDLNEYFWSSDCFALGRPMREDVDFFKSTRDMAQANHNSDNGGSLGKSYFVEARSFWHTFRSFDRMWTFFTLALQIMIIIAWNDVSVSEIFEKESLYSIFVTASFFRFFQSVLDIVLNFPGYHRWKFTDVLRNILKVMISLAWSLGLLVAYRMSSLYCVAVALYLLPNLLAAVLVVLPMLQRRIENSSNPIIRTFLWWSQIRTLDMLRSRFQSIPGAFNAYLLPSERAKKAGFLVSEKRLEPLLISISFGSKPQSNSVATIFACWQVQFRSKDNDLWKHICADEYMKWAVIECYESLKLVFNALVVGETKQRIILVSKFKRSLKASSQVKKDFLSNFSTGSLPTLHNQFVILVECLKEGDASKHDTVVLFLQDIELKELGHPDSRSAIVFPPPVTAEQIKRLYLLLTTMNPAIDVPKNPGGTERRSHFLQIHSYVCKGTVMTPYYNEETLYSKSDLDMENEDGISIMYYLQKIFPDEWENFKERVNCKEDSEIFESDERVLHLRHWVSLRGQTLYRTVRGMMYYRRALKLQAFLDTATDIEISQGYKAVTIPSEEEKKSQKSLYAQLEALADLKFTYVASCQNYGNQKRSGDHRATDIFNLIVK
ncbi:callose synthase 5 [Tanacetum coccineum]